MGFWKKALHLERHWTSNTQILPSRIPSCSERTREDPWKCFIKEQNPRKKEYGNINSFFDDLGDITFFISVKK